ncbi:MAG: hypothetical protein ACKOJI_13600 [Phycisphaerales bacterium]
MHERRPSVAPFPRTALAVLAAIVGMRGAPAHAAQAPAAAPRPFHEQVDLRPLDAVAVFTHGRTP